MVGDENAIRTARTAQTVPERRDGPPSYSWWMDGDSTKKHGYPLVNIQKTMENHHV